jgi:beta-glucuronidase
MTSRRDFLAGLSTVGATTALPLLAAATTKTEVSVASQEIITLTRGWEFRLDPAGTFDPGKIDAESEGWKTIETPHTWQVAAGSEDYDGVAWYRLKLFVPEEWKERFVRVEFEAVSHTAHIFLNGAPVGEHIGKPYTAFMCDLQPALRFNEVNTLLARADNTYSDTMLPRMKSYDWANDGGMIRPVHLLVTPRAFVERVEIDATSDLDRRQATITARVVARNTLARDQKVEVSGACRAEGSPLATMSFASKVATLRANASATIELGPLRIDSPALWHFDAPNLYEAEVRLNAAGQVHASSDTFGIRKFEVRGDGFYLNGERVFLMGLERMAGSHPDLGMAETTAWIEANHRDMKELNCVFTRVHWAQDRRVLDFCDRHGILMQEEIPSWGWATFQNTENGVEQKLQQNGLEQLREMIQRDRNHPSIVSWGLCNEVNGKNPVTQRFAHAMSAEARRLDPGRLQTYASNSLQKDAGPDMAGDFDFISWNEYYGTWYDGGIAEMRQNLDRIRQAFPGKPIVISEYGWCECTEQASIGDAPRVEVIGAHTDAYRAFPEVAGAIYFDYNDYRTLIGDKGIGAFKQRVHGVVDLYANRKPSFEALRAQSSPIEQAALTRSGAGYALNLTARKTLPCYALRGYSARWVVYGYDDLPTEGGSIPLPDLQPGETHTVEFQCKSDLPKRVKVDILRPTGFSVATASE